MNMIVHRVSPQQARYTPAGGHEKCSFCRFYIAPKWCGHVTGPVSPMGWCKYFSQEMRQQFGGSTVTSGIPSGATLSLDFMSSGNMPPGITFTRASTATYTDASGVIQTAAVNQPRWDYAGGSLRGLLIEEARSNVILQSTLGVAPWASGGNVVAGPVGTANNTTAPDGTLTATRLVYPVVSGASAISYWSQNYPFTVAGIFSVYLRGAVGGEQIYVCANSGANFVNGGRLTLTTQWQRYTCLVSAQGTGWFFNIGTDLRDGGQTSTPAGTIYAWGAQVEPGTYPTSYIPTTAGTVTRAQDFTSLSTSPWLSPTANTWLAEFVLFGTSGGGVYVVGGNATGGPAPLLVIQSTYQLQWWDGAAVTTANGVTLNAISKGVSSFGAATGKICLNGGAVVSGAVNGINIPTVGFLEPIAGASIDNGSGYMRRVQYWPRVLSNAEMQQVTA